MRKKQEPLLGHEQVYHAALRCQAASLPLTAQRLRGEKKACPAKGKKKSKGSLFCPHEPSKRAWKISGNTFGMGELSGFKGFRLITRLTHPHAIHNADPDVCQRAQSHAVRFAFRQFALVIRSRPWFRERGLPGKLLEVIAP